MKTYIENISLVFNSIFKIVSASIFPIIGILACICSAYIEYMVLKHVVIINGIDSEINYLAILITFVLEGTKFVLHFYVTSLKNRNESEKSGIKKLNIVKWCLVLFSVFCSIICFMNSMWDESFDNSDYQLTNTTITYYENEITEEKAKLESIKTDIEEQYGIYINSKKETLESLENYLHDLELKSVKNNNISIDKDKEYKRKEIETIKEEISTLQDEEKSTIEEESSDSEDNIKDLKEKLNDEKEDLASKNSIRNDNKYIREFLNIISQTLFDKTYSRKAYLFCTMLIGILIAVILECCIVITQGELLAMEQERFITILGISDNDIPNGKKFVNTGVKIIFGFLISIVVYGIVMLIFSKGTETNGVNGVKVMLTYFLSILIINFASIKEKTYNGRFSSLKEFVSKSFSNWLIPGVVSAGLYFILGYLFFNSDFQFQDIQSFAIASGGSIASGVMPHISIDRA